MARLASPVVFFTHRSVQTSLERNIFVVVRNLIGVSRAPEPSVRLYPLGIRQLDIQLAHSSNSPGQLG